jgi:SSS family solute:Na+ symporter
MVAISMAGPKVNPKAFEVDSSMFKLKPTTIALIVATMLILTLIYVRFW